MVYMVEIVNSCCWS